MVTDKYPTKPLIPRDYNSTVLSCISLDYIKSISEMYGIQIEIYFKPEGLKVQIIKKETSRSVKRRTFYVENSELDSFTMKLNLEVSAIFV